MAIMYKLLSGVVLIFFSFVKYETLEKIGYVILYTVFYWNDIFNRILIFLTEKLMMQYGRLL